MTFAAVALAVWFACAGAFFNRMRGSSEFERATGRGAATARIAVYAVPLGLCAAVGLILGAWPPTTAKWWIPVGVAVLAWAGSLMPQKGIDMGRSITFVADPDGDGWRVDIDWREWVSDAISMLWRGAFWTWPMAVFLCWIDIAGTAGWPLFLGPVMHVLTYEIGWRLHGRHRIGGTEWGEYLFGAFVFSTTFLSAWSLSQ